MDRIKRTDHALGGRPSAGGARGPRRGRAVVIAVVPGALAVWLAYQLIRTARVG